MDSTGYDILATAQPPATDSARQQALIQQLLTERFHLQLHRETQETPSYLLTVAKDGHKLKEVATPGFGVSAGPGRTQGRGADMETLAHVLAKHLARPVQDKTGLHGYYEFVMTWSPIDAQTNDSAPDLMSALQDQVGLKLQSSRSKSLSSL